MRAHSLGFLGLILGAATAPLPAQVLSTRDVGRQVRLTVACPAQAPRVRCGKLAGRVEVLDADSLTLSLANDRRERLAWADVQKLSISNRTRGHAVIGLLAGTGLGVAVSAINCSQSHGEYAGLCAIGYFITVPAGALIGTLIGSAVRTPVWEVVPLALPVEGVRGPSVRFGLALRIPI